MRNLLRGRVFVDAVFAGIALLILESAAFAQSPAQMQLLSLDPKYQEWQYFYQQRAYPFDQIPPGAYQAARQEFAEKFGATPAGQPVNANVWSSIGPSPLSSGSSGRINAIAINPSNSNIIYIGAAQGGVWETTDGGVSWAPLTDGQCSLAMGALAIDPVNPNIVYAGTGEENFSLDSYYGCGVLRSADAGVTWTQLGAATFVNAGGGGATISRFLVDPTTAGSTTATTVMVSASSGVYRSTDSGSTWTQTLAGTATDVVRDPSTPTTLYAALGSIFGSASNGVYKSTNGGQTWVQLGGGFPTANVGRINIGIAPSAPATLYAAVQNSSNFALLGIWTSTNGGTNWTQLSATGVTCTFGGSSQCWYDLYVVVDPINANTVYVGTQEVYKSTDGGNTFTDIGGYSGQIHPDQHALITFRAGDLSSVIFAGNDGGVWKSTNGGANWSSLNANLTITQFGAGLSVNPNNPAIVMGGTQDNGTNLYTGSSVWSSILGGDGGFTAIDFNTPTTGYSEFTGVSPQKTTNLGPSASWSDISAGVQGNGLFYSPFVMSPSNSQTLYLGSSFLNKTTNGGGSWSGVAATGSVSAIAEAKSNSAVVYYGTSGGDVEISSNGGASFTSIKTGLPIRYASYIAVNPTNAQNAFVTFSGFGTGHVFATTNGGTSWTDIDNNLPNIPVNAILLDPAAPATTFYVGTDLGVFRTTNGGASWSPFQTGLPDVAVVDLTYSPANNQVLAATHGRGVWETSATVPGILYAKAADFNGDGRADLLLRYLDGTVVIWLMNANGTVMSSINLGKVPLTWQIAGVGDFNGDGTTDIVWRNIDGTVVIWLLNTSAQVVSNVSLGVVDPNYAIVGTGDFDGNGKADILWRNFFTGDVAMWLMSGTTISGSFDVGVVPTVWQISGVGNFAGPPKSGILWRNTNSGDVVVWLMNGQTVMSSTDLGVVALSWAINGTGDFDGNGTSDVLWRNANGTQVIWEMNGATVANISFVGGGSGIPVSQAWQILATGDFNGDSKTDILWRCALAAPACGSGIAAGTFSFWLMNGAAISSQVPAGGLPLIPQWLLAN